MRVIKYGSKSLKELVKEISDLIKEGRVIICPTDTVYGLIADATNQKAIEKVFKIKKRQKEKALSIFVENMESAKDYAVIGSAQETLLNEVWPGKVTAVLRRKEKCPLPLMISGKEETIGLRVPDYDLINSLSEALKIPLTGTSANISGNPSSVKINKVVDQFKNQKYQPDLIIDAGDLEINKPSTVIDLTKPEPRVLRIGSALKRKEN
jgi:L-threonylcarbamoyladenylate synthase